MVKLLDCTTRDGGYCTNWNFSDEYIYSLMSILNKNKIEFFEIGYRNFYDREGKGAFYYCIPDFIKKFYECKASLNLGVMVDTKRYNEIDFTGCDKDCVDFVRIATHPDKIEETLSIAENLYDKNYTVMIQLMDLTNLSSEHYRILENWKNKDILKTIYLADTYGIANPDDIEKHYNKLCQIGFRNIGFHAHNHKHLALKNTIMAIEKGAFLVDVTQDGNGINGGNLSYDEYKTILINR